MIANSSMVFDFVAFAQSINNTSHQEPSVATTISNQTQSIGPTAESIYRISINDNTILSKNFCLVYSK